MLTRSETAAILHRFAAIYPMEITPHVITVWHDHIGGKNPDVALAACDRVIATHAGFAPNPALFNEAYGAELRVYLQGVAAENAEARGLAEAEATPVPKEEALSRLREMKTRLREVGRDPTEASG